jgi:phosphoribosylformylglycinamidine synthase
VKIGVVIFPGSNCDHDAYWALKHNVGVDTEFIFHKEHDLKGSDAIVLPGGFSYGDYLRSGAIARFSPIMKEVVEFAERGGPVIGICNGFQVLCEVGLLPGALARNRDLRFVCRKVQIRVERDDTIFSNRLAKGDVLAIPVAHGEGNYYANEDTLRDIEENRQVLFRYCEADGRVSEEANPNGSQSNIAGLVNRKGNVLGMMPHPERACDPLLGSTDGVGIFKSIVSSLEQVSV